MGQTITYTVHPRACGEHLKSAGVQTWASGSSPRLRGTRRLPRLRVDDRRFIPAPPGNTKEIAIAPAASAVHPRACGEHSSSMRCIDMPCGSSPRLRGTLLPVAAHPHGLRFIPAPAGNTASSATGDRSASVHPRACGEHGPLNMKTFFCYGSSPRLRGTRFVEFTLHPLYRFIPAPAGNTFTAVMPYGVSPVHPRACGEHGFGQVGSEQVGGSSPRLRGTRLKVVGNPHLIRFIPAPAGNTVVPIGYSLPSAVHPRACGEHIIGLSRVSHDYGSSPRLRGTRQRAVKCALNRRFIPAPAGNTGWRRVLRAWRPVHPRACGEHAGRRVERVPEDGSSPRLRGTRLLCLQPFLQQRFIPAPAGNTIVEGANGIPVPVHPRACGEHAVSAQHGPIGLGSSPRLRGTLFRGRAVSVPGRFIPAPAGNTGTHAVCGCQSPVHPRACGEHGLAGIVYQQEPGSSPRLRGTPGISDRNGSRYRFIPAPAGNTADVRGFCSFQPVHPRACGEHGICLWCLKVEFGSSPRLRGTQITGIPYGIDDRFIPAPAGNTIGILSILAIISVHPRACGEHMNYLPAAINSTGSSPRLRGTHVPDLLRRNIPRFIPAPAGNTTWQTP